MDVPKRGRGRPSKASKAANVGLQQQKLREKDVAADMMEVENDSNQAPRSAVQAQAAGGAAPAAASGATSGPLSGQGSSSAACGEAGSVRRPVRPRLSSPVESQPAAAAQGATGAPSGAEMAGDAPVANPGKKRGRPRKQTSQTPPPPPASPSPSPPVAEELPRRARRQVKTVDKPPPPPPPLPPGGKRGSEGRGVNTDTRMAKGTAEQEGGGGDVEEDPAGVTGAEFGNGSGSGGDRGRRGHGVGRGGVRGRGGGGRGGRGGGRSTKQGEEAGADKTKRGTADEKSGNGEGGEKQADPPQTNTCAKCQKTLGSRSAWKYHTEKGVCDAASAAESPAEEEEEEEEEGDADGTDAAEAHPKNTCEKCRKTFGSRTGWKYHTQKGVCDAKPSEEEEEEEEEGEESGEGAAADAPPTTTCEKCQKTFGSRAGWKYHTEKGVCDARPSAEASAADDEEGEGEKKAGAAQPKNTCEKCQKTFGSRTGWKYHTQKGVCDAKEEEVEEEEGSGQGVAAAPPLATTCGKCKKTFGSRAGWKYHTEKGVCDTKEEVEEDLEEEEGGSGDDGEGGEVDGDDEEGGDGGSGDDDDEHEAYDPAEEEEEKKLQRKRKRKSKAKDAGTSAGGEDDGEGDGNQDQEETKKTKRKRNASAAGSTTGAKSEPRPRAKGSRKKFKGWTCGRCGAFLRGEAGAAVCDKVLFTMQLQQGKYWDGKKAVPLPEDGMEREVGFFSPPYPLLSDLGPDVAKFEKLAAKVRADSQPVQCEKCLKTFNTKPGWKYHVHNGVCDIKSPQLSVEEAALAYEASNDSNGPGRKRKAATKAASVLAAAAAAGSEDEEGVGGAGAGDNEDDGDFSGASSTGTASEDGSDDSSEGSSDEGDGDGSSASKRKGSLSKSKKKKKAAVAAAAAKRRRAKQKAKGVSVPYWQQNRQLGGRGGSKLTVGGYSATAFTHSGANSGRTGSAARTPSDFVLEGKGESAAAAIALSTAGGAADDDSSGVEGGRAGAGSCASQEGRGLNHARMLAAVARARLDLDLEPGARPKGTLAAGAAATEAGRKKGKGKGKMGKGAGEDDDDSEANDGPAGHQGRGAGIDHRDAWGVGTEEDGEGEDDAGGAPQKRSWREVPDLRRFLFPRKGGVGGGASWETTTLADWAKETGGGGGRAQGRLPTAPVKVEVVSRAGWDPAGIRPIPTQQQGAAGKKPAAARTAAAAAADSAKGMASSVRERIEIPPLQSYTVDAQEKAERPEAVLNAAGSVWDVDTLLRQPPRPPQQRKGGSGEGGVGSSADGPDLFLAVGTGPLRQTDQPIDEADVFASAMPYGRGRPSPLPLVGNRTSGSGLLQVWRAKNASVKLASSTPIKRADLPAAADAPARSSKKKGGRPAKDAAAAAKATEEAGAGAGAGSMPAPNVVGGGDDGSGLFELAYAIAHDGGGVAKCRWAPDSSGDGGAGAGARERRGGRGASAAVAGDGGGQGAEALGLLAALFHDGSLRVYVCPDPDEVTAAATRSSNTSANPTAAAASAGAHEPKGKGVVRDRENGSGSGSGSGGAAAKVVLETKPILHVQLKQAGLQCLDWSPHDPNLLLAGASDGTVGMWKVSSGGGGREGDQAASNPSPFRLFSCAAIGMFDVVQSVVYDVAWCPDSPTLFATTGAGHILTVWDSTEVFEPVCSLPVRTPRCAGTAVRWGPGRSGVWITMSTRPFLIFLDFFDGSMREVVFRDHVTQTFSSKAGNRRLPPAVIRTGRGQVDSCPLEDASWGLDLIREPAGPLDVAGSADQSTHLSAWTAPSGQVRVTAVRSREISPNEHHHLAAAFVEQFRRSKTSQRLQLLENRVMHRVEYVRPGDRLVDRGEPWCTATTSVAKRGGGHHASESRAGGEGAGSSLPASLTSSSSSSTGEPYLRVFAGHHSEGLMAVKWHEAMPPLPGLLQCTRFAHVPLPPPKNPSSSLVGKGKHSAAAAPADGTAATPGHGTCVLVSGGHGGLVRCSVVPPHATVPRRFHSAAVAEAAGRGGRTPAKGKGKAAPAGSASAGKRATATKTNPNSGETAPLSAAAEGLATATATGGGSSSSSGAASDPAVAEGAGLGDDESPILDDDVITRFGPAAAAALASVTPFVPSRGANGIANAAAVSSSTAAGRAGGSASAGGETSGLPPAGSSSESGAEVHAGGGGRSGGESGAATAGTSTAAASSDGFPASVRRRPRADPGTSSASASTVNFRAAAAAAAAAADAAATAAEAAAAAAGAVIRGAGTPDRGGGSRVRGRDGEAAKGPAAKKPRAMA